MKQKQKRKHLESMDSQETAKKSKKKFNLKKIDVQHRHKVESPNQGRTSEAGSSSSSKYFPCISSEDKLIGVGLSSWDECTLLSGPLEFLQGYGQGLQDNSDSEYLTCASSSDQLLNKRVSELDEFALQYAPCGLSQSHEQGSQDNSAYFSCASSVDQPLHKGISGSDGFALQYGPRGFSQGHKQWSQDNSDSEYFSCACSVDKILHKGISGLDECALKSVHPGLYQGRSQEAPDNSESEYISCASSIDQLLYTEFWKSQGDVPQLQSNVLFPIFRKPSIENSSASEYFSCVSAECKLTLVNEDGTNRLHQDVPCLVSSEMPPLLDSKKEENSSPFPHASFPFQSANKTRMYSVHITKKERVMKVYYMKVQMKRGVAVLGDTEEGLEPPEKKTQIEEMSFPEKIHTGVTLSHVFTHELLTENESSLNREAQEEMEEGDNTEEPPALEESSRAKTPDWLVALESGFRCMGCCQLFPNLEDLQEHVEHGVNEGFSCHAFHLAMAWLKNKRSWKTKKKGGKKKRKKINRKAFKSHQEKEVGMRTSSYK